MRDIDYTGDDQLKALDKHLVSYLIALLVSWLANVPLFFDLVLLYRYTD